MATVKALIIAGGGAGGEDTSSGFRTGGGGGAGFGASIRLNNSGILKKT